jgi:hypothetical protein
VSTETAAANSGSSGAGGGPSARSAWGVLHRRPAREVQVAVEREEEDDRGQNAARDPGEDPREARGPLRRLANLVVGPTRSGLPNSFGGKHPYS